MSKHSPARANVSLLPGLELFSRGKVRDTYILPNDNFLSVTTDGISIFDFVLNALVPGKGVILNAMSHFWFQYLSNFGIKTHFIAAGSDIDEYIPEMLKGDPYLQVRATVVKRLNMVDIEFVARAVLTGSALKSYKENLQVCGHRLPPGLQDCDELPYILDTPTTKAKEGHDENLLANEVRRKYPEQTYLLLMISQIASNYSKERGIKLADMKLEFGEDGTVGDEILTPDSSRFLEYKEWFEGRNVSGDRKAPPPYDKQLIRNWGIAEGINKLDPKKPEDIARVHNLIVPEKLIRQTTETYRRIFWRLTGFTIASYLRFKMKVNIPNSPEYANGLVDLLEFGGK